MTIEFSRKNQWICDPEYIDHLSIESNIVQFVKDAQSGDNPCNVLYEFNQTGIKKESRHLFEFHCESQEGNIFVGLTTKTRFASGYKIKGLFFSGNLACGSSILAANFGKHIYKGNSMVCFLVDTLENALRVYIVQDGRPLGLAFEIEPNLSEALFPVVQFSGSGKVKVVAKEWENVEGLMERAPEFISGLHGDWKIEKFILNNSEVALSKKYVMQVRDHKEESLDVQDTAITQKVCANIKVVNSVGIVWSLNERTGLIQGAEQMFSTLMFGSREMMNDEQQLKLVLGSANQFNLNSADSELVLEGPDFTLKFKRFFKQFEPVKQNVLESDGN